MTRDNDIYERFQKEFNKLRNLYSSDEKFQTARKIAQGQYFHRDVIFPGVSDFEISRKKRISLIHNLLEGKSNFQQRNVQINFEDMLDLIGEGGVVDFIDYNKPRNSDNSFDMHFKMGSLTPVDLVETALENLGISVRNRYVGIWDGEDEIQLFKQGHVTYPPSSEFVKHFIYQPQVEEKETYELVNNLDGECPIVIAERRKFHGRKHGAMRDFLLKQGYGLELERDGQLAFSYIRALMTHPCNPILLHSLKVL